MSSTLTKVALQVIDKEAIRIAETAEKNLKKGKEVYAGCYINSAIIEIASEYDLPQNVIREEMWTLIKHHRARLIQEAHQQDRIVGLTDVMGRVEESNKQFQMFKSVPLTTYTNSS